MKILIDFFVVMALVISASFAVPVVHAQTDTSAFDQMLKPIQKVYDFVKYAASLLAMLAFAFAGIQLLLAGKNNAEREKVKSTMTGIVVGLAIIWIAPLAVPYLLQ